VRALEEYAERELPECWHDVVVDRGPTKDHHSAWGKWISQGKSAIDHVVVHDVRDLARSKRVFDLTVTDLHNRGITVHIVSSGVRLPGADTDPISRAFAWLLRLFGKP
jgi:DNA invertase Pin-like site-specific DNA recombinase